MILSQDLDYLFGQGHRRFLVASCITNNQTDDSKFTDLNHYTEDIGDAQKLYDKELEKNDLWCASLAVVIDDSDGDPFSNGAGYVSLLEAVADISQMAGASGFYSGDSRQDIKLYIQWAIEFEKIHLGVKWGQDETMPDGKKFPFDSDYMLAIEKFAELKLNANKANH